MLGRLVKYFLLPVLLLSGIGCATTSVEDEDITASDPYESYNRSVYAFNSALDGAVLKPIASAYRAVFPSFVRIRVGSFFGNLGEPLNLVNNLAQVKPNKAAQNLGRFVVNSTIGVAGFFDVATDVGIQKADEDFGQTIRKATDSTGAYIVLPLLGPSTTEDAIGTVGDILVDGYLPRKIFNDDATENVLTAVDVVHTRSEYLDFEETIGDSVFDEYSFIRDAYLERRKYLTADEDQ